jgi:hypothetical protein
VCVKKRFEWGMGHLLSGALHGSSFAFLRLTNEKWVKNEKMS